MNPGGSLLQPYVDIVIPHHDHRRDVARAVRSVVAQTGGRARAIVVCHNKPENFEKVRSGLSAVERSRLKVLHLDDGIHSPTGPFNAGLDAATAPYVGILSSDDYYEPQALSRMWREAESQGSDAVLASLYFDTGRWVATPRARPFRTHNLQYARDRLAYRTAPLGLLRRSAVEDLGLRMTPGVATGEDIAFTTELFTSGARIDRGGKGTAYIIGTDAPSRVSYSVRPLNEELKAFELLANNPVLGKMSVRQRESLAIKIIRIHLLGTLSRRTLAGEWVDGDLAYLQAFKATWEEIGGGEGRVNRPFNRADRRVLDVLGDAEKIDVVAERARYRERESSTFSKVLAGNPASDFHRESTLRAITAENINRLAYAQ